MERPNWGRWGLDDEVGALNLLAPEVVKKAASLVKKGEVFSLAHTISERGPMPRNRIRPLHLMLVDGGDYAAGMQLPDGLQMADEVIMLKAHGTTTHIDALSHIWYDNRLYNNHDAYLNRSKGAARCGIEKVESIVGRGVLLDIAALKNLAHLPMGYLITVEDLEACCAKQRVTVQAADIVLIRTGYMQVFYEDNDAFEAGQPGIGIAAAKWLRDRDICAVGADNITLEVNMNGVGDGGSYGPVHILLLRDSGIYIMELLDLDRLAAAKAYEFLFVGAPLRIEGGVGSPLNPIAIT